MAARLRPPGRRPSRAGGTGRICAAVRGARAVCPVAGRRSALYFPRAGARGTDPARRGRGSPQPREPRPVGGARRPGCAATVDRRGRRSGVAAAVHCAGTGRCGRGRGRASPVPRPGLHRCRPHRTGSGEPGSGPRAYLRDRPPSHDHPGAVRDGHGTGHQPLVRRDAHHAGRLRRRPDPDGPRPDHRGAHRGRGAACPGSPRRPGGRGHGGVGGELRAGRAVARRESGRLGAALPDQRGAAHPVGAQPAARARPGRPRRRGRLCGRRRRPRLRLGLGSHAGGPAAGRGTRLRRAGPAHPGPSARSAGGPVRRGSPAGGRGARAAASQRGAAAAPGTRPRAAGGSHRPRPRCRSRHPACSNQTGPLWPPSSWSTWPCILAACTPTC